MDALVIGGTFYFGKRVVRLLLERGHRVTVLTRGRSRPDFWDEVDHILADRDDRQGFVESLRGRSFDLVFDQIAYRRAHIEASLQALRGNVGKYILTSTISVYGGPYHALAYTRPQRAGGVEWEDAPVDLASHVPISEDALDLSLCGNGDDPRVHEYAEGKRQCERALLEAGIDHVSLRLPPVLGPEAPYGRPWWYLQRLLDGREMILFDGGHNLFRNIYSADAAQALVDAAASDRTEPGPYNVAQGEIMTLRRFLESMARAFGTSLNAVAVPAEALLQEGSLPWHDWRFDPFSRPESYVMDIHRARRDFDLRWTPQDEWMADMVEWYRGYRGEASFHYAHRDLEVTLARDCRRWALSWEPAGAGAISQ